MSRQYGEPCLVIEGNSGSLSSTNWGNFYLYLLLVHSFWCPDMFRYIETRHFPKILPSSLCRCRCDSADTGVRCVQCPVSRRRHTLGSTHRAHTGDTSSVPSDRAQGAHIHITHILHMCVTLWAEKHSEQTDLEVKWTLRSYDIWHCKQ